MDRMNDKEKIVEILASFKVGIERIECTSGPSTTLYEIKPKLGVRISKIRNLKDEIAVGLEADNVRVIAPIPGKGTVGIEVPNKERKILGIDEVLSAPEYENSSMALPCVLGRTITNDILMADLSKMPHLLIAGATGQGKSVGLNTILMSLLHKKSPDEMKLILVDPKQVEFSLYSKLGKAYLAKDVITDADTAYSALCDVINLMESRYTTLSENAVRNIGEYNAIEGVKKMQYLVVVIDEYGDLIMQSGKDMEKAICRIAQKARAVGIHLILSTQRPSVKIVTGDIKANFPTRIAFRMTTGTDSRVVLGKKGAECLTGKGDMLFFNGENTTRAQCAFTPSDYVRDYVDYLGMKYKDYSGDPLFKVAKPKVNHFKEAAKETNPIFYNCIKPITPELEKVALDACDHETINAQWVVLELGLNSEYEAEWYLNQLFYLCVAGDCQDYPYLLFVDVHVNWYGKKEVIRERIDKLKAAYLLDRQEAE